MSKLLLTTIIAMAIASATMLYSVVEFRAVVRLDSELERLMVEFLRDQAEHREYIRKADAAARAAEQSVNPLDTRAMEAIHNATINLDLSPKTSPTVKPGK